MCFSGKRFTFVLNDKSAVDLDLSLWKPDPVPMHWRPIVLSTNESYRFLELILERALWWPWMKKAGHRREVGQDIPQVFFFTKSASHPPIFSFQICIVLIVMMWKLLHRSLLGLWNCVFFRKNLLCFFVCFIRNWNKLTMSGGSDQLRMQGRISPRCLA